MDTTGAATGPVFNPSAEAYEAGLVPVIFQPWARRLVGVAEPRVGERVLDLACGTGIVALTAAAAAGPAGRIAGLDVNPDMLAVARHKATEAGLDIEWVEGDASAPLPFPDGAFDVVICQQGLQFFADRPLAVKEVRRVVAPRGRVVLAVWRGMEQHPAYQAFDAVAADHLPAEVMEHGTAPFDFGDVDELRTLLQGAFGDVSIRAEADVVRFGGARQLLDAVGGAFAPMAAAVAAMDGSTLDALLDDLGRALRPYTDDYGVAYPMVASVAVARP